MCCHLEHIRKHGKEINTVHTSVHMCECAGDDDDGKDEVGEAIGKPLKLTRLTLKAHCRPM